jgi:hypothetical protein
MITCPTCGAPCIQEQYGRPRRYCGEPCRRAADTARKASRVPVEKPIACIQCGEPITQKATGRPRHYCVPCGAAIVQQKPARKATAALSHA